MGLKKKDDERQSCSGCAFALFEDYGYSNYTVEGTTFTCMLNKHPEGSFDRFYGEDEKLLYADECPDFTEGDAIDLDVDGENESDRYGNLTPIQSELLKKYREICASG